MYTGGDKVFFFCFILTLVLLIAPNEAWLGATAIMIDLDLQLDLGLELEITIEGMLNGFSIAYLLGLRTGFLT